LVVPLHRDPALELVMQDSEGSFQALRDIDVLHWRLVHVGVFLDRTHQVRDSRGTALDFVQQVRNLHRGGNSYQGGSGDTRIEVGKQRLQPFRLHIPTRKISGQLPQVVLSVTAQ